MLVASAVGGKTGERERKGEGEMAEVVQTHRIEKYTSVQSAGIVIFLIIRETPGIPVYFC